MASRPRTSAPPTTTVTTAAVQVTAAGGQSAAGQQATTTTTAANPAPPPEPQPGPSGTQGGTQPGGGPGTSGTTGVPSAKGRHPNLPATVTAVYQQHRRVEEQSTVSQVATAQAPMSRAEQLRSMGLVEVTPGVFHEIARAPATTQQEQQQPQQQQLAAQVPVYNPPPAPNYAPPFMDSPIRPGFEGMPPIPQYGGEYILHLESLSDALNVPFDSSPSSAATPSRWPACSGRRTRSWSWTCCRRYDNQLIHFQWVPHRCFIFSCSTCTRCPRGPRAATPSRWPACSGRRTRSWACSRRYDNQFNHFQWVPHRRFNFSCSTCTYSPRRPRGPRSCKCTG